MVNNDELVKYWASKAIRHYDYGTQYSEETGTAVADHEVALGMLAMRIAEFYREG